MPQAFNTAGRTRYRMFIDDTGLVTNLTSNNPQQRFAGITGVILRWDYLSDTFDSSLIKLKQKHFGLNDKGRPPILHLRQIKKGDGAFASLRNAATRKKWQIDCLKMYEAASYSVISVGVDKVAFYHAHPNWEGSIYELLVGNAIERYFYFLRYGGCGDVMAEAINKDMDHELKKLYRRFYEQGTDHIPANRLQKVLTSTEIKIQPKEADIQGLQLADMLASTCLSHLRRIYASGPVYDDFAMEVAGIIEGQKFYRDGQGNPHRYGRIWRP
jgi:hypothetical protein